MALALGAAGCQVFGGARPVATYNLPDLPRAASVLSSGESFAYRDLWVEVTGIAPEGEDARTTRVTYQARTSRRGDLVEGSARLEEYVIEGDYMFQFLPRDTRSTPGVQLVRVNTWYLPALMGKPREFTEPVAMRLAEKDLAFFPGGFVVLERVHDNDFRRLDDDSATIQLYFNGERQVLQIQEMTWIEKVGVVVEARDIYAGNLPGQGRANLRIRHPRHAWSQVQEVELIELDPGKAVQIDGVTLRADTMDPRRGDPDQVLLVMEEGPRIADAVLRPGEGLRFSNLLVMVDGQGGEKIQLSVMRKPVAQFATLARVPGGPVQQVVAEAPVREDPPMIRRTLRHGDKVQFWDLEVEINQVLSTDLTRLFEDVVEVTVTVDNTFDVRRIREGARETVTARDRWYVIRMLEIHPSRAQWGQGTVVMELSTGTYLNQPDAVISNF